MYAAPKIYKASTLILVEAQRIPRSYVKPTITEDLQSRLHTITQQINSRSYLEKVIKTYNLYLNRNNEYQSSLKSHLVHIWENLPFISEGKASQDANSDDNPSYAKVSTLQERIGINLRGRDNRAFEISFQWQDPEVAAKVANAIASQFIEQNLRVREEMAMGTTDFLSLEVDRLRSQLETKERALENFRQKNMGKLPEQLETNLNILNQQKDELNNLEKRVDMEKQQAMMLRRQIRYSTNFNKVEGNEVSPNNDEITVLKERLDDMKSRYTDKHPDIVALKKLIENKLKEVANDKTLSTKNSTLDKDINEYMLMSEDSLQGQLARTQTRIDRYEQQISQIKEQIKRYKQRVEETPKIEMQLKDLQRDYDTVNKRYQNILAKKLDSRMAEEVEKRQKGEQFKVLDAAIPPSVPFKPDMRKLGFMTFLLGLGLGGGMAYLRESLDPAFFSAEDAESYLGRKIIVTLPWENSKE